jgi:PAS domain S-box-containing protein
MGTASNLRLVGALRLCSQAAGGFVAILGCVVLAGWGLDIAALKSVAPGLATMKANTALALAVAGASLCLDGAARFGGASRRVSQGLAAIVVLISILTLVEYASGINLGIDELLCRDDLDSVGRVAPGRMALMSTISLLVAGVALILLDAPKRFDDWPPQVLGLLVMLLSMLALEGYVYGVIALYLVGVYSSVAVHTALALFVLGTGIVLARPDGGLMGRITAKDSGGWMLRTFLPVAILMPFFLGWLALEGNRAGLYDTPFGIALLVLALITTFTYLLWWNAGRLARVDQALRTSEERLRLAFQVAKMGWWQLEPTTGVSRISAEIAEMFGLPPAETQWNVAAWRERLHPVDRERVSKLLLDAVAGLGVYEAEYRIIQAGGEIRWIASSAKVFRDSTGRPERVIGIASDITRRKEMEAAAASNQELQREIAERKAVEGAVRRKNRDLETLLYVTSHDLREPLRAIQSFSRLLHERYREVIDEKGLDFLQRVVRGAERMDRLLLDILTLSRVQRMELGVEEVCGQVIVAEALRRLQAQIQEKGARIQVADDLPRLRLNQTWATQGVYNLVANALKFTNPGQPPDIEIGAYRPADGQGGGAGFVVRDRGPGIASQHTQRVFELFQRAVGREIEGTGAGLAIVQQVAERHGGRAWVEPREGGGSEFIITFGT